MRFANSDYCRLKKTLCTSLYIAAVLSLMIDPLVVFNHIGTLTFNRLFGQATLSGLDASLRIQLFTLYNVIFIPFCLFISFLVCHLFVKKIPIEDVDLDREAAFDFMNKVSICALSLALVFILNKYNKSFYLSLRAPRILAQFAILSLPAVILCAALFYIRKPFLPFAVFRSGVYVSLGITLFISFILQKNGYVGYTDAAKAALRFYLIYAIITGVVLLVLHLLNVKDDYALNMTFAPLSFGMLFAGLTLELCNILNQYGVYIVNRLGAAKLVYCIIIVIVILRFIISRKRSLGVRMGHTNWKTISALGLVVSLVYFTIIPSLTIYAGDELFEQANQGMLAIDFLAWGKLPIVNSFDGHMLSISLPQIVYGLLNSDIIGSTYYGYSFVWMLPFAAILFITFKELFDEDFAFFLLLIAPFALLSDVTVNFGMITVIALLYAMRKKTIRSFLFLLFSIFLVTVYQAPMGISYGASALIVVAVVLAVQGLKVRRFTEDGKAFVKAIIVFTVIMALLWSGLCLIQGVNPISRAMEFIGIAQSTNVWTYNSLGDRTSVEFNLVYSVLPIMSILCLLYLVLHYKNKPLYIASITLLLAYIVNWSRALGRHSMHEMQFGIVIWTAMLGIALFAAAIIPRRKYAAFIIIGIFVLPSIFNMRSLYTSRSIADAAIMVANDPAVYYNGATEKTVRVNLDAPLNTWQDVLDMIETVIPEGETYMDLSSQTTLYALAGREKPVYINQSPLHLSSEYTQKQFINEVEHFDGICDFALLYNGGFSEGFSGGLDGVSQPYRYYLVYEYLYENFRPLCKSTDKFALWVRKDRYDEFAANPEFIYSIDVSLSPTYTNAVSILSETPLSIKCEAKDPSLCFQIKSPLLYSSANDIDYQLELVYQSSLSGKVQLFCDYTGFCEDDSTIDFLSATDGKHATAFISFPSGTSGSDLKAIRLDPVAGATFEIQSLRIIASNRHVERTVFHEPIRQSSHTNGDWVEGVLRTNPNCLQFETAQANVLKNAKTVFTTTGHAEIIDSSIDENWLTLEMDDASSIYGNEIIEADIYVDKLEPINYVYLGLNHSTVLGEIPYIWGAFDRKEAWDNTAIAEYDVKSAQLSMDLQNEAKYACITLDAASEGHASLVFTTVDGEQVSVFEFTLLEGKNRYIIRVSTDWWWNNRCIDAYSIETDVEAELDNIKFLVGD